MPNSNVEMMRKLQIALNSKGAKILCNRSQFYSEIQKRPVTVYKLAQAVFDERTGRNNHETLFSSASQIQVVLFMRNLWYALNDKEIPPTNQMKGAEEFTRSWEEFVDSGGLDKFLLRCE